MFGGTMPTGGCVGDSVGYCVGSWDVDVMEGGITMFGGTMPTGGCAGDSVGYCVGSWDVDAMGGGITMFGGMIFFSVGICVDVGLDVGDIEGVGDVKYPGSDGDAGEFA